MERTKGTQEGQWVWKGNGDGWLVLGLSSIGTHLREGNWAPGCLNNFGFYVISGQLVL